MDITDNIQEYHFLDGDWKCRLLRGYDDWGEWDVQTGPDTVEMQPPFEDICYLIDWSSNDIESTQEVVKAVRFFIGFYDDKVEVRLVLIDFKPWAWDKGYACFACVRPEQEDLLDFLVEEYIPERRYFKLNIHMYLPKHLELFKKATWHDDFMRWFGREMSEVYHPLDTGSQDKCIEQASQAVSMMDDYDEKEIKITEKAVFVGNSGQRYSFEEFPSTAFLGAMLAMVTVQHNKDSWQACGMQDRMDEWNHYENKRKMISAVFYMIGREKELIELERIITPDKKSNDDDRLYNHLRDYAVDEIKKLRERNEELENKLSEQSDKKNKINDNADIICGPYKITKGKKTAFMSVIWVLKELGYFEKREDGTYATNRADVIQQLIDGKANADQLLPKALKTETFMNVFNEMTEKANKLYGY